MKDKSSSKTTILALDTALQAASVALSTPAQCLDFWQSAPQQRHEHIMPAVHDLLSRHQAWTPAQLSAVAVTVGPGSFTGLRIGLATAIALAYGWNKPLLTCTTFEAIIAPFHSLSNSYDYALVIIPASRQSAYCQAWRPGVGQWQPWQAAQEMGAFNIRQEIIGPLQNEHARCLLLTTDEQWATQFNDLKAYVPPPQDCSPNAKNIATCVLPKLSQHNFTPLEKAAPLYLKKSQAETKPPQSDTPFNKNNT
jgi:tRNA threonylcarbamoyladenosine biosynthesis protein TsaB